MHFWKSFSTAINYLKSGNTEQGALSLDLIEKFVVKDGSNLAGRLRVIRKTREIYGLIDSDSTALVGKPVKPLHKTTFVIVTPVFNGATFIEETIASVINQKGDFFIRYHIQDGGSKDKTKIILQHWESRLRNTPEFEGKISFSWCSEPDEGMYDALSRGFEHAFGALDADVSAAALMSWINADDLLPTNSLRTVASFFAQHTETEWITGMGALLNEAGVLMHVFKEPVGFSQRDLAAGFHDGRSLPFVQQEGTFWRRSLWNKAGGLNRSFKLVGDWDLWRRFASHAPLVKMQTVLGLHRRRSGQLSGDMGRYYAEIDTSKINRPNLAGLDDKGLTAQFELLSQHWDVLESEVEVSDSQQPTKSLHLLPCERVPKLPPTLPDGKPWPKISIVTPSFNQGQFIAETIESILQQGYPAVEHIVIDGGSDDETLEVLDRYRDHFAYVVSERDKGQSDALNKGFARATGDILCWLNSDDRLAPGALAAVAVAFATSGADLVSGICEVYRDGQLEYRHMSACENGPLPLQDLLDLDTGWNCGQFFYQPEVFFTRALWEKAGAHVRVDCFYSMDYELWCRFAAAEAKLHVIGRPLARFRMHPGQKTADPALFKAELVKVRDRFAADRGISIPQANRPTARWDRRLRIAMVNDLGLQYGAGIAQGRIAAGIEMAGHEVKVIDLKNYGSQNEVIHAVSAFGPDAVIFGNLHAEDQESVSLVEAFVKHYPTFWVTHDFWLLTGRCAYTAGCNKYLSGCDALCPTYAEYPELEPDRIANAWLNKWSLLGQQKDLRLLANSHWSADFSNNALSVRGVNSADRVQRIRLGAPAMVFHPMQRTGARDQLGISRDHFVIAFSMSNISDERKGWHFLVEALRQLHLPKITLVVIGNSNITIDAPVEEVVGLGYVKDTETLVMALSAADVYVGPSTEETFGQVFIEAAFAGTPSIGFNRTGMKDAIIDGVTGLLVDFSAEALRDGFLRLYRNRDFCKALGSWAYYCANNEFTLEQCYRSLFNVWRRLGLVDKWQIPHRTGFTSPSALAGEPLVLSSWQPVKGISPQEGPYPNVPFGFHWCHGLISRLKVHAREKGSYRLRLRVVNPLFEKIGIKIYVNGLQIASSMLVNVSMHLKTIEVCFSAVAGWNHIELRPDKVRLVDENENRELSFMLINLDLVEF